MTFKMKDDGLTGSRHWSRVGSSVYRKGDVYVWRDGRQWYRAELPTQVFRWALQSVGMREIGDGLFTRRSGPFSTMAAARRGRR